MKKKDYKKVAKTVSDLEIKALKKLKKSINNSFNDAVNSNCKMSIKNNFMWCWKKWINCKQDCCNTILGW